MKARKRMKSIACSVLACAAMIGHASALEYTMEPPADYLFGKATSMDEIHLEEQPLNVDRSKNTSLIPPGFGSATSYLPGSGEYLTPNLVPGAFSGGLTPALSGVNYPAANAGASYTPAASGAPAGGGSASSGGAASGSASDAFEAFETPTSIDPAGSSYDSLYGPTFEVTYSSIQNSFDSVTDDSFYADGRLGTLSIPSLGVNVKVYEGTDNNVLAKGAGHFTDTSIGNGNVCIAGHNRGANCYFGDIHKLNAGDEITLDTKLGTRTYAVSSVEKIGETDGEHIAPTSDNCITLFTCVRNESAYRWCVRADEVTIT